MSTWDPTNFDEGIAGYLNRTWNPGDQSGIGDTPPYIVPNIVPSAIRFQNPPPGTTPAPAAAPPAPSMTDAQHADYVTLDQVLAQYGLGQLDDWARQQIINGTTSSQIQLELYDPTTTPGKLVHQMYPELQGRQAAGAAPWSIDTALQYRDSVNQLARQYQLPDGFITQDMIVNGAVGNVSPSEWKSRLDLAQQYALSTPAEDRAQFDTMFGTGAGDHTAYWIDPTTTVGLLQQRLSTAGISGAGIRSGYGALSSDEASRLAQLGMSGQQAQQGLGQLYDERQLFSGLPGTQDGGVSREQQLAAAAGDAAAQQAIARQAAARKAVFGDGGGFAGGQAGVTGVGRLVS